MIGSNLSTNEENYILQKFDRTVLRTNNIDHRRTADFTAFFSALAEFGGEIASMAEVAAAPAILLIGSDSTYRHPLLAWQIRRAVRQHGARLHIVHSRRIKLCRQATQLIEVPAGGEADFVQLLLAAQEKGFDPASARNGDQIAQTLDNLGYASRLVIVFGAELTGTAIRNLVRIGSRLNHARFICLGDGPNFRGAVDMGVLPDRLPGYETDRERWSSFWKASIPELPGMNLQQMLHAAETGTLSLLYSVGADPVGESLVDARTLGKAHLIVHDLFLARTAAAADVVFPTASPYEKSGTFTNTCGDLQVLCKAADMPGVRSDLEIILQLARMLGAELTESGKGPQTRAELGESRGVQSGEVDQHVVSMRAQRANLRVSSDDPDVVLREIQRALPGYDGPHVTFRGISAPSGSAGSPSGSTELIQPYEYDLFSSPFYGRYSATLHSVLKRRLVLPGELPQEDPEEDRV